MATGASMPELIDSHYESLFRYAYRLSGNESDAADLTQETYGKALARLSQLRDVGRAKSWLFQILRNVYLHRVRDERRRRVVPLDSAGDLAAAQPEALPEFDSATLQQALNDLDETFRTPLILFYFEEFSYRDIADQLDLPIGTVMSRLARAKGYLRERLSGMAPMDHSDNTDHGRNDNSHAAGPMNDPTNQSIPALSSAATTRRRAHDGM